MRPITPAFFPKAFHAYGRVDAKLFPTFFFITDRMERPVAGGTERHGPLVTNLPPDGPGLGERHVMGVAW